MRSFRACFWIRVRCEPQTDPTLSTVYQCRYEYEDNERKKLIISSTHLRTCVCYNQSREGFLCFRWISFGERAPPIINEEELFSLLASWELAIIVSYLHSECLFQVSLSRIEVNVVSPTFFCKVRKKKAFFLKNSLIQWMKISGRKVLTIKHNKIHIRKSDKLCVKNSNFQQKLKCDPFDSSQDLDVL